MKNPEAFITVDIGNSFIKYGLFTVDLKETSFPLPVSICVETTSVFSDLSRWLIEQGGKFHRLSWVISSVNEKRTSSLRHWIERHRPWDPLHVINYRDVPVKIEYDHPDKLGTDRVVAAFAARKLLKTEGPILVVDIGTATTIDLVGVEGSFLGGAILPGPQMSAQVLYDKTEQLPHALLNSRKPSSSVSEKKSDFSENEKMSSAERPTRFSPFHSSKESGIEKDIAVNDSRFRKDSGQEKMVRGPKKCPKSDSSADFEEQKMKAAQGIEWNSSLNLQNPSERTGKMTDQDSFYPFYPARNTENGIQLGICTSLIGAVFAFYIDSVRLLSAAKSKSSAAAGLTDVDSLVTEPLSIPIVIAERGSHLIEKPLSDFFDNVADLFGSFPKPKIRTCSFLILSGLAALASRYQESDSLEDSENPS